MAEKWSVWKPITGIDKLLTTTYLKCLIRDNDVLLLSFEIEEQGKLINVSFNGYIHSYRSTDEGNRLKMLSEISDRYGEQFIKDWRFFKVDDSEYINWLNEQNFGVYVGMEILHFVFITNTDVIEVLSGYYPEVRIVDINTNEPLN
jgi:hypothetical protein